jgi:hypothetical protein
MVRVPVGLGSGDLLSAGAGHDGEDLVVLVGDAQHGVFDLDGDGLAGVVEADGYALADDLDAALSTAVRAARPPPRTELVQGFASGFLVIRRLANRSCGPTGTTF